MEARTSFALAFKYYDTIVSKFVDVVGTEPVVGGEGCPEETVHHQ